MELRTAPKSSKHDNCDRKSLNNLMETIKKLQNIKPKPNPSATPESPKTPKRKRRNKATEQSSKITTWLNKENTGEKRPKPEKPPTEPKLKPLDITINKESKEPEKVIPDIKKLEKNRENGTLFDVFDNDTWDRPHAVAPKSKSKSSKSKSLKRTSSFEKYGIVLPSFEKIVSDHQKFDEHKDSVKLFDDFDDEILDKSLVVECLEEEGGFEGEILDCKHLSLDELDEAFKKNLSTLSGILKGEKYSERHQRFHRLGLKEMPLSKDLRCSTSLVVFTQEQKDHLLDLMRLEFDPEDKMTSYFFKVLLPELCLSVFMDVHGMSKRKANAYLDRRPLDI